MRLLQEEFTWAWRRLRRSPGFVIFAILPLALGVGAVTATFSLAYGLLLRPLPVRDPAGLLVLLQESDTDSSTVTSSPANLRFVAARSQTLEGVAGWLVDSVTLSEPDAPSLHIDNALVVSPAYFDVVGVSALAGRTIRADEIRGTRRAPLALISEGLWRTRWGSDADVIGSTVSIDGSPHTVVGVMAERSALPDMAVQLWLVEDFDPANRRLQRRLGLVARVGDGVELAAAQAELDRLSIAIGELDPSYRQWRLRAEPAASYLSGGVRPTVLLALGAVGLLFLLACANLSNLGLARGLARWRETAVMSALGAGRRRIVVGGACEGLILSLLAVALAYLFALWMFEALFAFAGSVLPRPGDLRLDTPVLAAGAGLTLVTGISAGILMRLLSPGGGGRLAALRTASESTRSLRLRSLLIVFQGAVTVALVFASALMLASLDRLYRIDPGFDVSDSQVARIFLDGVRFDTEESERNYLHLLLDRLGNLPGVVAAGATTGLPMDPVGIDFDSPYLIDGIEVPRSERPRADYRFVSSGYLDAVMIPLYEGRDFRPREGANGGRVALVNRKLAEAAWPGQSPIGKRISIFWGGSIEHQVVGVVGDIRFRGLRAEPRPEIYLPLDTYPFSQVEVVARGGSGPPSQQMLLSEIMAIDPLQPPHSIVAGDSFIREHLARERFFSLLLAVFGLAALTTAAISLYGMLTLWVRSRRYEIGVRQAIGASREQIRRQVLVQGVRLSGWGLLLGLGLALAVGRSMESVLFGLSGANPAVLLMSLSVVVIIQLLACWVPAQRAAALAPLAALANRTE